MSLHHRGGARPNAGRKSGWSTSDTQTIRVPKKLSEQLIEIAKKIDLGETIEVTSKPDIESTLSAIQSVVKKWLTESANYSPSPNTRWDNARKLLKELESVLHSETMIEPIDNSARENLQLEIESDSITDKSLTGMQLADRLGVNERTVRFYKEGHAKVLLPEWTQSKDPSGIAWNYNKETKRFYPLQ
jgi:hypothetical protein